MIKPIDEIPKNTSQKRESYREMIRNDIREAMDKGIDKFEFIGEYKYKYLAVYAREEAKHILYNIARERFAQMRGDEEIYLSSIDIKSDEYIQISSLKGETPDRPRVFCRIDLSGLDDELKALVQEKSERSRRYQEIQKRMKLRMEANDETETFDFPGELP